MSPEKEPGSLFSKYKKAASEPPPAAAPAPVAAPAHPLGTASHLNPPAVLNPPQAAPRADDGRFEALETVVNELKKELAAYKNASLARSSSPLPLVPPPLPAPTLGAFAQDLKERLERSESVIAGLRAELGEQRAVVAAWLEQSASKYALETTGLKISDLGSGMAELKQSVSSSAELVMRLERSEAAVEELRQLLSAQQAQAGKNMGGLAQKETVDAIRLEISGVLAAAEGMKKDLSQYAGEFSRIETECRRSVGEMQGHTRNIEQKFLVDGVSDYLKDSVTRLHARLAEVETGMHASLSDMSGRLTMSEVLAKKVFAEAESRVMKSVEPKIKDIEGQLKWLRDNVIRLSDDYTVVAERKMRALEGKYSAFEAIARRMDAIDAALKMAAKTGLP